MRAMIGVATVAVFALAGAVAYGHSGATGIVKERMMTMKSIAGAMKAIAKVDWSDRSKARKVVKEQAGALQGHASQIVNQFPQGSIKGPSEATTAIWKNPDRFAAIAQELEMSAGALAVSADTANGKADIMSHFQAVGGTCKSCHAEFRKKK